ncbi:hypothetical protein C0991_005016 [Blastosporella zonata]|nr:hypothetical protein C0991_005016 [Blastosporella zonata]
MANLLVVLAEVNGKPLWMNVETVLRKHLSQQRHTLVYVDQDTESSTHMQIMLLCSCSTDLDVASSRISQDLAGVFASAAPDLRLYKSIMAPLGVSTLDADQAEDLLPSHVLVSVAMTPIPSTESAFNAWYLHEHIPLLQRVPTWVSSERFILDFTTDDQVPHYLALHRWNSMEAFDTDEYRAATNTQWRTAVMSEIVKKERIVLIYEGNLASLSQESVVPA